MYKIQTLNNISPVIYEALSADMYTVSSEEPTPDAILVRSFAMHDMELPDTLLAVARAGAGTNNIPIDKCSERGIVVFNTPGANANAVAELVMAGLLLASRKISDGIQWCKELRYNGQSVEKQVEAGKKQFIGPELAGKTLGVIGLGAIGLQVANAVKKHMKQAVFRTAIPRNVRLSEAPSHGKPITAYDRACRGADAYRALAEEFLKKNS